MVRFCCVFVVYRVVLYVGLMSRPSKLCGGRLCVGAGRVQEVLRQGEKTTATIIFFCPIIINTPAARSCLVWPMLYYDFFSLFPTRFPPEVVVYIESEHLP